MFLAIVAAAFLSVLVVWFRERGRSRAMLAELRCARDEVERRVAERTEALETGNETLRSGRSTLEAQLRQAQKIEAIGLLAGGVAHDFNNLLTVIMAQGQLLLDRLAADGIERDELGEILKAARRAASLTRQLLAFSRRQVLQPRDVDLNALVLDLHRMMRRLIGEDIDLRTIPARGLGRIHADPGQIEQVIMNLIVNARDAMPNGGQLTIETMDVEIDAESARRRIDARPGPHVMLAVSDTGQGISAENLGRIFEPFFTTKAPGRGTGLGLSTVHGIVRHWGGHVEVDSEQGLGSTFRIYLPRVDAPVSSSDTQAAIAAPAGGEETILLVEDEELVRHVIRGTLVANGYRVLEAADGSDGLATIEHEPDIALLVTDVVLPVMSGAELARRATLSRPDLRILFMSGYTDRALVHRRLNHPGSRFLQKPFGADALLKTIRTLLDAPIETLEEALHE